MPGDTTTMKTAISVPDEPFNRASRQAASLGVSRSGFFSQAAERYVEELESRSLTHQIDEALKLLNCDDSGAVAAAAGRALLSDGDEGW